MQLIAQIEINNGILAPYIPCGGKRALQAILNAGWFISFEGMEYVKELGA